jgi:hypothetical protein
MNNERMLKILFKYFDIYFDNLKLETKGDWEGFYLNGEVILGRPIDINSYDDKTWYYDGTTFTNFEKLFDISLDFFKLALKSYIFNKFGIKIKNLS